MEKLFRNLITRLIDDAEHPSIEIYRDGKKQLHLPSVGDPYYSVDAYLEDAEVESLKTEFPELPIIYL
jgi:hypothetical protein